MTLRFKETDDTILSDCWSVGRLVYNNSELI